jgi:hypothetical protein
MLAGLASNSSTESSELGKTFPAFDPTIAGTGAIPNLIFFLTDHTGLQASQITLQQNLVN